MSDEHTHFSSRVNLPLCFMKHIMKVHAASTHTSIHSYIFVQVEREVSALCSGMLSPGTH